MNKSFSILTLNSVVLASLSMPVVQAQQNITPVLDRPTTEVDLPPIAQPLNDGNGASLAILRKKKRGVLHSIVRVLFCPFGGSGNSYYASSTASHTIIRNSFGWAGHSHCCSAHS